MIKAILRSAVNGGLGNLAKRKPDQRIIKGSKSYQIYKAPDGTRYCTIGNLGKGKSGGNNGGSFKIK